MSSPLLGESAQRLARAICSDISLYHREALANDPTSKQMKDALREGIALYRARASDDEYFTQAADELLFTGLSAANRDELSAVLTEPFQNAPRVTRKGDTAFYWLVGFVVLWFIAWILMKSNV